MQKTDPYKKRAFGTKNGSLTGFSYNSLISNKILDMQGFAYQKHRKFEKTSKNQQIFLFFVEKNIQSKKVPKIFVIFSSEAVCVLFLLFRRNKNREKRPFTVQGVQIMRMNTNVARRKSEEQGFAYMATHLETILTILVSSQNKISFNF